MLAYVSSDQIFTIAGILLAVAAFVFIVDVIYGWSLKRAYLRRDPPQ